MRRMVRLVEPPESAQLALFASNGVDLGELTEVGEEVRGQLVEDSN